MVRRSGGIQETLRKVRTGRGTGEEGADEEKMALGWAVVGDLV